MKLLTGFRRRWAQASLEYDLEHGRRQYGRTSIGDNGPRVAAEMPVEVTIAAKVTRANGDVEDLGVVSRHTTTMSKETLAKIDAVAKRRERRRAG